jgi:hypothetical protein
MLCYASRKVTLTSIYRFIPLPHGGYCRICGRLDDRPMSQNTREIESPTGKVHLTEGRGHTICGRNCVPWEPWQVREHR